MPDAGVLSAEPRFSDLTRVSAFFIVLLQTSIITAIVPLTSIATILTYGPVLNIKVYYNDGRVTEIAPATLPQYVTEKGNPKNEKEVREVIIHYPSPYLQDGVRLIDTPGVGSVFEHNTDVAYQYLPKSDAALFLLSVDQPVSKAELDFLKEVKEYSNRIFFLQNKADYVGPEDLAESISFSKKIIEECLESEVKIFPLSAKWALQGKLFGAAEALEKSLLPDFEGVLNTFLMQEKGSVLLFSVTNHLLRALSQAQLRLEIERRSLETPLEELQDKLTRFRQEVTARAENNLEALFKACSGSSLRALREQLEKKIISEVKEAFTVWRRQEDEKLAGAFEAACKRFIGRIDAIVDGLLKFSADLFSVPYDMIQAEALWSTKSGFYYRFEEQPGGIEIVAASLTLLLPKFIGEKVVLKKMQEYLYRVFDLHAARIGNDFERWLDKGKLDFRWEMFKRIEATLDGISRAIETGQARKSTGERTLEEQKGRLFDKGKKLEALRENLERIRENLNP